MLKFLPKSRNVPIGPGLGCDMIVKAVTLFLVGMAVLAMFGKLRFGKGRFLSGKTAKSCPKCGRHLIGKGPCPCTKG